MTNLEFVIEWFAKRPLKKFSNAELEKNLREEFESRFGKEFRDPLREARKAHERGILQRSPKGPNQVYWFDPKLAH
jgi:hypothetical protein